MRPLFRYVLLALLVPGLSGCVVPWAGKYVRVRADEATYFNAYCYGDLGPPKMAYLPFNGIYLSALVDEEVSEVGFGVHVPPGMTVQLMQRELTVRPNGAAAATAQAIKLEPVAYWRPRAFAPPWDFYKDDPLGREDYFGVLAGAVRSYPASWSDIAARQKFGAKWYRFAAPIDVKRLESGTIDLPAMMINGVQFKGPSVRYEKTISVYAQPINC